MRKFIDLVSETTINEGRKIDIPLPYDGNSEFSVSVFYNPSRAQAAALLKKAKHGIRALVIDDGLYMWDASDAIHGDVAHYFIGRSDKYWYGFAIVPQDDDLVTGDYDSDEKPIGILDNFSVYGGIEKIQHIEKVFPDLKTF